MNEIQKAAKVAKYQKLRNAMKALCESDDPRDVRVVKGVNAALVRVRDVAVERAAGRLVERDVGTSSVHADTFMSNLSVQYANEAYLADQIMPVVPVEKLTNIYPIYDKRNRMAAPDDTMAEDGDANMVSESRSTGSYKCIGRALKGKVEQKVIDNEDAPFNELLDLNESVAEKRMWRREKRVLALVADPTKYGSTTALAGSARWDTSGGGNPVGAIKSARRQMFRGAGASDIIGVTTRAVFDVMCTNPAVLEVLKYTQGGIPTHKIVANILELDELLVSDVWEDIANKSQSASFAKMITSGIFALQRRAKTPRLRNASWGYTMLFKGAINTTQWFDPKKGTRGTYFAQQTSDECHKNVAIDLGHLITGCITV